MHCHYIGEKYDDTYKFTCVLPILDFSLLQKSNRIKSAYLATLLLLCIEFKNLISVFKLLFKLHQLRSISTGTPLSLSSLSLMELALSLQSYSPKPYSFLDSSQKIIGTDLGFCMAVGKVCADGENNSRCKETGLYEDQTTTSSSDPPVQLDLLPFSPVHRYPPSSNKFPFTWLTQNLLSEEKAEEGPSHSSPNSTISSFQMEFSKLGSKRNLDADKGGFSRGSDDEAENYGSARKKLRLSKHQSAFLEDSFKEHSTLNPKEKLALAKMLNLRPRQVEVWFQNRRARTKLKQTEVDCEYLKKCCETLREENRRLQKEVQELRALNASKPFYMQLPATTLIMCPSCERVATTAAPGGVAPPATTVTVAANDSL